MSRPSIWIGYDRRRAADWAVCAASVRRHSGIVPRALDLEPLRRVGLYRRPTSERDGRLWDDISGAPMSTEFAISRFLVPHLAGGGRALFMDSDMLARRDMTPLLDALDGRAAVMVVKHAFDPPEGEKMDGQAQLRYARKNWSSLMLFDAGHRAHAALTLAAINGLPGRDLHRFCWLDDSLIGELPPTWNWLAGHSDPASVSEDGPAIVHYTDGTPDLPGYEDAPFADEWRAVRDSLAEAA